MRVAGKDCLPGSPSKGTWGGAIPGHARIRTVPDFVHVRPSQTALPPSISWGPAVPCRPSPQGHTALPSLEATPDSTALERWRAIPMSSVGDLSPCPSGRMLGRATPPVGGLRYQLESFFASERASEASTRAKQARKPSQRTTYPRHSSWHTVGCKAHCPPRADD